MKLTSGKAVYLDNEQLFCFEPKDDISVIGNTLPKAFTPPELANAYKGTMAYQILSAHNVSGDEKNLRLKFDALTSHDITYVGIIQTARASGLKEFPVPYVMTNCHNSLCAVGGTINEDDHLFGHSAAEKYGGIYVPAHIAVIHSYMREMMAGCGKMILGSDSHTRYGALGTMAVGEGGPEIVKQLLSKTYDIPYPQVIAVKLTGKVGHGVGPQDVALAIIGEVFSKGFVKNKVLEFIGDGVKNLTADFRCGIDVMTTETACLSSIWTTDETIREYYKTFGREEDYRELKPAPLALYDGAIEVDLSEIQPMIAMPFHPSNVYPLKTVIENPKDVLREVEKNASKQLDSGVLKLTDKVEKGRLRVSQGIIAGCAGGTFENLATAANILASKSCGAGDFSLSVYPGSQPIYLDLVKKGIVGTLAEAGAVVKTAFCGPCFGAGDVPANNALSIRHTTRNFPNREGSKPGQGQIASVALMDARSIAATAANGGILTSAADYEYDERVPEFTFDDKIYRNRVYNGFGKPTDTPLKFGPNIADWPKMIPLTKNILLKFASAIYDPVTTTDELIPSGETSSYRSNPLKLAEFTLSRKDPSYVRRAKSVQADELARRETGWPESYLEILSTFGDAKTLKDETSLGSAIFAIKPGDGSAREQAASCQRVLGGLANVCNEYATKRYRSNLINWGMIPFVSEFSDFEAGDYVFVENIADAIEKGKNEIRAKHLRKGVVTEIALKLDYLTEDEREIILSGCLINYYAKQLEK